MITRRTLLASLPAAGLVRAADDVTHVRVEADEVVARVNPMIFGQFIEHLGRCIYGGIYEEGSPLSDEHGFRKDVLEAVKRRDEVAAHRAMLDHLIAVENLVMGAHKDEGVNQLGGKKKAPKT